MAMANMGKASTAVRKPKIKRDMAASAAGNQATFICGGFFGFAWIPKLTNKQTNKQAVRSLANTAQRGPFFAFEVIYTTRAPTP